MSSDDLKDAKLRWLRNNLARAKRTPTQIANDAGLSPSTLLRYLKPDYNRNVNDATIVKVAIALGVAPPEEMGIEDSGFATQDVEPFDHAAKSAPTLSQTASNTATEYQVKSESLSLAGFMPGDILAVEHDAALSRGDIVLAEFHNRAGKTETVLRVYEGPYLTARCLHPPAPILIDGENTRVIGKVVQCHRYHCAV